MHQLIARIVIDLDEVGDGETDPGHSVEVRTGHISACVPTRTVRGIAFSDTELRDLHECGDDSGW